MERFEFHNPTKIVYGALEASKMGQWLKGVAKSCLLVMGKGSARKSGAFDRVAGSLKEYGIEFKVLEGVKSNPVLSKVKEGIEVVKRGHLESVLALGGGSVMDTAKAIAAGALMEGGNIWDVFLGKAEIEAALPIFTCPTLAASGSEMNGYMVITNEETGHKLATGSIHVYPRVSVLDPELTVTVPRDYTAYGGVDAVCHLMEPYFNGPAKYTPVQDALAESLMKTIMNETMACLKDPSSLDHRGAMMWGATLALNGLTKAGVGEHHFPVHLIEHAISAIFDVPHGAGLGALLPGWMRFFSTKRPERLRKFAIQVMGVHPNGSDEEVIQEGIITFSGWLEKIGTPSRLKDLGIGKDSLSDIAHNASFQASIWGMDGVYSGDVIHTVLTMAY